jgi:hypothetical protein
MRSGKGLFGNPTSKCSANPSGRLRTRLICVGGTGKFGNLPYSFIHDCAPSAWATAQLMAIDVYLRLMYNNGIK